MPPPLSSMVIMPHEFCGFIVMATRYPQHEGDGALLNATAYTQPALFAVEYALSLLLRF